MHTESWTISAPWLLSAVTFAVAATATPGPNNAMVTASGANYGFARTIPHIIGISLGFPLILSMVALGAAKPLYTWPLLHQILRFAGALYMCRLAWKIIKAPIATSGTEGSSKSAAGRPLTFFQALSFQFINPKVWIIAAGTVVTYTVPGTNILMQMVILNAIFLVLTPPAVAFWTFVGIKAKEFLKSPKALRNFNYAMAALLIMSVIPLIRE